MWLSSQSLCREPYIMSLARVYVVQGEGRYGVHGSHYEKGKKGPGEVVLRNLCMIQVCSAIYFSPPEQLCSVCNSLTRVNTGGDISGSTRKLIFQHLVVSIG